MCVTLLISSNIVGCQILIAHDSYVENYSFQSFHIDLG
jgi:hypothetical protein